MDSARVILVALFFTSPFIVIHAAARWNAADAVATASDDCKTAATARDAGNVSVRALVRSQSQPERLAGGFQDHGFTIARLSIHLTKSIRAGP